MRYDCNQFIRFIQYLRVAKNTKMPKIHSSLPYKRTVMFGLVKGSQRKCSFVLIQTNVNRLVSVIVWVDDSEH